MKLKLNNSLFIAGALCICLHSACLKRKDISPTPSISYNSFTKFGTDSAVISINFKDGDGDVGLNPEDTTPPFNPSSVYYKNLYMLYYYKGPDGNFHRYKFVGEPDSIQYSYRIPDVTPKGQNKILEGEIKIGLDAPFYVLTASPAHTVIRYKIYMYDRALNKSNEIFTDDIKVP